MIDNYFYYRCKTYKSLNEIIPININDFVGIIKNNELTFAKIKELKEEEVTGEVFESNKKQN